MKLMDSRKWRALAIDAIFSIIILAAGRLLIPDDLGFVLALIGILQPVVLAFIVGTAWEDSAAKRNGTFKSPQE